MPFLLEPIAYICHSQTGTCSLPTRRLSDLFGPLANAYRFKWIFSPEQNFYMEKNVTFPVKNTIYLVWKDGRCAKSCDDNPGSMPFLLEPSAYICHSQTGT